VFKEFKEAGNLYCWARWITLRLTKCYRASVVQFDSRSAKKNQLTANKLLCFQGYREADSLRARNLHESSSHDHTASQEELDVYKEYNNLWNSASNAPLHAVK
jgi:hypothetical protein